MIIDTTLSTFEREHKRREDLWAMIHSPAPDLHFEPNLIEKLLGVQPATNMMAGWWEVTKRYKPKMPGGEEGLDISWRVW